MKLAQFSLWETLQDKKPSSVVFKEFEKKYEGNYRLKETQETK